MIAGSEAERLGDSLDWSLASAPPPENRGQRLRRLAKAKGKANLAPYEVPA